MCGDPPVICWGQDVPESETMTGLVPPLFVEGLDELLGGGMVS